MGVKTKKVTKPMAKKAKHKFESFREQVKKLKVPHFAPGIFGGNGSSLVNGDDDFTASTASSFETCLQNWRDLNLSESFVRLSKKAQPLAKSLGQLIFNKEKIVDLLQSASNVELESESDSSLEPILDLWHALAMDLQSDFWPFFTKFSKIVVLALRVESTVVMKMAFSSLAGVIKVVHRGFITAGSESEEAVKDIFSVVINHVRETFSLKERRTYFREAVGLIAVALAQIIRTRKEKTRLIKWLFSELCSEHDDEFLGKIFLAAAGEPFANLPLWRDILTASINELAFNERFEKFWKNMILELDKAKPDVRQSFLDEIIQVVCSHWKTAPSVCFDILCESIKTRYKKLPVADKVLEWASVVISEAAITLSRSEADKTSLQRVLKTVILASSNKCQTHRQLLAQLFEALIHSTCLDFSEKCLFLASIPNGHWCHDLRVHKLLELLNECENEEPLQIAAVAESILMVCQDSDWDAKFLELPGKVLEKLAGFVIKRSDLGEELDVINRLLMALVYIRPHPMKTVANICAAVNAYILNNLDDNRSDQFLLSSVRLQKKMGKQMDVQFMEKILPTIMKSLKNKVMAESLAIITLSDFDEELSHFFLTHAKELKEALVAAVNCPCRETRIFLLRALGALNPNVVLERLLKAELTEPDIGTYRDRLRLATDAKGLEDESTLVQRCFLKVLLSNFYEDFSLLWKPIVELLPEVETKVSESLLWSTMLDFFEPLLEPPKEDWHGRNQDTARVLMLQGFTQLSNSMSKENVQRIVVLFIDKYLQGPLKGARGYGKSMQEFLRFFSNVPDKVGDRKDKLNVIAQGMLCDRDIKHQHAAVQFFCAHFKKVNRYRELLLDLCNQDKFKQTMRGLHETFTTDVLREFNVHVRTVLTSVISGALKRTIKEKAKKQRDDRKLIIESAAMVSKEFLFDVLKILMGELHSREKTDEQNDEEVIIRSHSEMFLDVCLLAKSMIEDAHVGQVEDWIVALMVRNTSGDTAGSKKQKRSKQMLTMIKVFKTCKKLNLDKLESHKFFEKCLVPLMTGDVLTTKVASLLQLWVENNALDYFTHFINGNKTVFSYVKKHLMTENQIQTRLIDCFSELLCKLKDNDKLSSESGDLLDLCDTLSLQLLSWLVHKKSKKKPAKVNERLYAITVMIKDALISKELIERFVVNLASTTVMLSDQVISDWFEATTSGIESMGEVHEKVFRCMATIKQDDYRFKLGTYLQKYLSFQLPGKKVLLEPYQMHDAVQHSKKEILYAIYTSLACMNSGSLDKTGQGLDAITHILYQLKETNETEFQSICRYHFDGPIRHGLRHKDDVVHHAFISLLRFLVKHLDRNPYKELKALFSEEETEVDFFENIRHLQMHRRARAMRRLEKMLEDNEIKFSSMTIGTILFPMVSRYILNVSFIPKSDLVEASISLLTKMCSSLAFPTFMRTLKGFIAHESTEKPIRKQRFLLISKMLQNYTFDQFNAEDSKSMQQSEKLMMNCMKLIRQKDEDDSGSGSLHIFPPIAKLAVVLPTGEICIQTIMVEICSRLKTRHFSTRQLVRQVIVELMRILGPAYLYFLVSNLEAALQRGYQKHVLIFTIGFILNALKDEVTQSGMEKLAPKLFELIRVELFTDFAKEKRVAAIIKKTPEAKTVSSYQILNVVASKVDKGFIQDLLESLCPPKSNTEIVQKIRRALKQVQSGLARNQALSSKDILLLSYGLLKAKLGDNWRLKGRAISNILTEFAFNLLLLILSRDFNPADIQPFMRIAVDALNFENMEVIVLAMKAIVVFLNQPSLREILKSEGLHKPISNKIGVCLKRYIRSKDNRPFLLTCKIIEKSLLHFKDDWADEDVVMVKTIALTELNSHTVPCSRIIGILSDKASHEEQNELVFHICKVFLSCSNNSVVSEVKSILSKVCQPQYILDFMMQNFQYGVQKGRYRAISYVHEHLRSRVQKLNDSLVDRIFFLCTHRYINEDSEEVRNELEKILALILNEYSSKTPHTTVMEWSKSAKPLHQVLASKTASLIADKNIGDKDNLTRRVLTNLTHLMSKSDKSVDDMVILAKVNILDAWKTMLAVASSGEVEDIVGQIVQLEGQVMSLMLNPLQILRERVLKLIALCLKSENDTLKSWRSQEDTHKTILANALELTKKFVSDPVRDVFCEYFLHIVKPKNDELMVKAFLKKLTTVFNYEKAEDSSSFDRRKLLLEVFHLIVDEMPGSLVVAQALVPLYVRNLHLEAIADSIEDLYKKLEQSVGTETVTSLASAVKSGRPTLATAVKRSAESDREERRLAKRVKKKHKMH